MSTSIGPTYDPASTAAALAEKYTASQQQTLKARTDQASATAKALSTLNAAILGYQSSLSSLTGVNKTMLSQLATFADPTIGSASASATASAGSYSFFVEQLATASQMSYADLPDATTAAGAGTLGIKLNGVVAFTVDLSAAATGGDSTKLTARELAAAINGNAANAQRVSASVLTINNKPQLVLTAKNTGLASAISLDLTNVADTGLNTALAAATTVVTAQNAIVRLGTKTGTAINQASNTFSNIDGVKMTFTRAQSATENPVTLTVAANDSATTANVQAFVDAFNKLKEVVDGMVASGNPSSGTAAGVFANDSGVKVLQSRLVSMLRKAGPSTLAGFGITANRQGMLALDSTRLTRQMALDPNGLDKLIGNTADPLSIAGSLDTYLKQWSGSINGQIKQRTAATDKLQTELSKRQDMLDSQYDRAYQRYLIQFTQLQTMQSQMASNTSMFEAMFGDKSN